MSHGTEHHLEHAEHVQHQAHDPFDRRVAMTMAILAAVLAGASMESHRAHTETLKLHIQANDDITYASNEWGYYQAKKNRQYLYEAEADALRVTAKDPGNPEAGKLADKSIATWKERAALYEKQGEGIKQKAEQLDADAKAKEQMAQHVHHRADRFDYGHLGLDLALVLCSIAVLTKQRGFWLTGIVIGALGAGMAISGFLIH